MFFLASLEMFLVGIFQKFYKRKNMHYKTPKTPNLPICIIFIFRAVLLPRAMVLILHGFLASLGVFQEVSSRYIEFNLPTQKYLNSSWPGI